MFRLILIVFSCLVMYFSASELAYRQQTSGVLATKDPLLEARALYDSGRLDEARLMAEFSREYVGTEQAIQDADSMLSRIQSREGFQNDARRFVKGALTGEPNDMASFLGSLSLDLFLIGDIRDITVQGYREISAGDGDMLILSLSAVGLATTLTPALDFAPALLKQFRRIGALGERFVKSLSKLGRTSLKTGDYASLGKVVSDFGVTARKLGPAPLSAVMKHVDEPAQLSRLAKAAGESPRATYGVLNMTDGKALRLLGKNGRDVSKLARMLTRSGRGIKIINKAVGSLSTIQLKVIFVLAVLFLLGQVFLMIRRLKRKGRSSGGLPEDSIPRLTQRAS